MFTEPVSNNCREMMIQELRADLRQMQRGQRLEAREKHVISTGIAPLDDILPDQGLRPGTLSEWISAEAGSGATTLAMRTAGQAQSGGPLVIVDLAGHTNPAEHAAGKPGGVSPRTGYVAVRSVVRGLPPSGSPGRTSHPAFYAPAFRAVGVCVDTCILIRPKSRADALWALEQSLRCAGIGVVVCPIDQLRTQEFRRLQLAAEAGTAVGILIRPPTAQTQPGWADVRLLVSPVPRMRSVLENRGCPNAQRARTEQDNSGPNAQRARAEQDNSQTTQFHRRMEVRCIYAKGGIADQTVELEMCDETGAVRLAAGLSDSTTALRSAGA